MGKKRPKRNKQRGMFKRLSIGKKPMGVEQKLARKKLSNAQREITKQDVESKRVLASKKVSVSEK